MNTWMTDDEERLGHRNYVFGGADTAHRERLVPLHRLHEAWNQQFFGKKLKPPHLGFGIPPARSLAVCKAGTDYGGKVQLTLHERLVFGADPEWLRHPWPADGVCRLIEDLLLRLTVRQYVIEHLGHPQEGSYGDYGPLFCEQANRVSVALKLGSVVVRRRPLDGDEVPLAAFWPCCVRDEDYYGDDVTPRLLERAAGGRLTGRHGPAPDNLGFYEYILHLLPSEAGRARKVLTAHIDRLQELRRRRHPLLRSVEAGRAEPDGAPLNIEGVVFEREWLTWDNAVVAKMLETIDAWRAYGELPILADALEDAGCRDGSVLRHLRARGEHTRGCWVLRGLREAALRTASP
jgi:hypothetical protein